MEIRLWPGLDLRINTPRTNWTRCTPQDARRCLSSRRPVPSAIDRSWRRIHTLTVEDVARQLRLAPSTLYRHLPGGRSALRDGQA